jgi:hypothetical protein
MGARRGESGGVSCAAGKRREARDGGAAGRQKEARLAVAVSDGERHEGRAKVEAEASPNKRMHRSAASEFLVIQPMRHAAPGDAWC